MASLDLLFAAEFVVLGARVERRFVTRSSYVCFFVEVAILRRIDDKYLGSVNALNVITNEQIHYRCLLTPFVLSKCMSYLIARQKVP
jgi:hypothetical protein